MKKAVLLLVVALLLGFTNPGMDDFRPFIKQVAQQEIEQATGGGVLGRVLGGAGSELVASNVDRVTTRTSYVVCSTYAVDADQDGAPEWEFLGVATRFVTLQRPERKK